MGRFVRVEHLRCELGLGPGCLSGLKGFAVSSAFPSNVVVEPCGACGQPTACGWARGAIPQGCHPAIHGSAVALSREAARAGCPTNPQGALPSATCRWRRWA